MRTDEHISISELEAILRSRGSEEEDVAKVRQHVASCDFCKDLVSLHLEQGGRLALLHRAPPPPSAPGCPPESECPPLAAGLVRDDQAAELLRHAVSCDHCVPLLRQALEDCAEGVPPAEEEFLAGLESARPESQELLATRLAGITRRP